MPVVRTAAAWLRDRCNADEKPPAITSTTPDVYLDIVRDDGEAITAKVAGVPPNRKVLLWIEGRGLFAIVAMLVHGEHGEAIYLRLRPWIEVRNWC